MSGEWPRTCRCGFTAEDEDQAHAHRVLEHPESFADGEEPRGGGQ